MKIRQAIDWFLTINLVFVMGYCTYLWYTGELVIGFREPPVAGVIETDIVEAFSTTLKMEVDRTAGIPENGYEPHMFIQAFPGLVPTDFEGVDASIGFYTMDNGRLMHKITTTQPRHKAAGAISPRGMATLLDNVSERVEIDLTKNGTITQIMIAISGE